MNSIQSMYFNDNLLKQDFRRKAVALAVLLAVALLVLVLQSFWYASSLADLWNTGGQIWGEALSSMLQSLAIWALVLGGLFAVRSATTPRLKYGTDFWEAVLTSFPLGVVLPFLLVLAGGIVIYILLGLLSLLVVEIYPYATLQFGWLAAAYGVFLWIAVGLPALLWEIFRQPKWYYKFIAVLLFLQLLLNILEAGLDVLRILFKDSIWQTNNLALLLAVFGSLLVSLTVALWKLRGWDVMTIVFAIAGIYIASVVSGNLSELLFHWGEVPAALIALLAPLLYVRAAEWILRRDGTALAGLAAGYIGLLTGLLIIRLLHLGITGRSWISLLYGVILVLGIGLALGYFAGRKLTRGVVERFRLLPVLGRFMDIGLTAGIMAGMLIGGLFAR